MTDEIAQAIDAATGELGFNFKAAALCQIASTVAVNLNLPARDARIRTEALEEAAKVADPPLMHRKGKVGLWRSRRAAIAAAIRALASDAGEG